MPNPATIPPVFKPTLMTVATSFHGLVLIISMLVIGCSCLLQINAQGQVNWPGSNVPMPEACLTKRIIAMDCPGCGMTRAFIHISHGRLRHAAKLNAASWTVYLFFAIQIPWHTMQLWRIRTGIAPVDRWWTILPVLIVIATMIGCWCWKTYG